MTASPTAQSAANDSSGGPGRRALGWILRIAISVLLVWLVLRKVSVREAIAGLSPGVGWWVLLAAGLYLVSMAINTLKWQLILAAMGHRLSYRRLYAYTLVGMFANLFLPTAVGGDLARVGLLAADHVPASLGALSVFTQRVTGFVALLFIGVIGLVISGELMDPVPRNALLGLSIMLIGLLAATIVGWWLGARLGLAQRLPGWLSRPLLRIGAGLRAMGGAPRAVFWVLVLSFVFQLWHVGLGLLLDLPAAGTAAGKHYFWLVPVVSIGRMVPVGLGGIGTGEQMVHLLLEPIMGAAGVVWALLWDAMVVTASLLGGLVWVGIRREQANRPALSSTEAPLTHG